MSGQTKSTPHKQGCTGKKFHATQFDAAKFAVRTARLNGAQRIYECRHCFGWHLTKMGVGKVAAS